MKDLLLDIEAAVDKQKENSKTHLELEQLMDFESRFQRIIALGYEENPSVIEEKPKGKQGRSKKTKARNLLERLDQHRQETLNFMYNFHIPFDNNQAERDIRMTKVKQKISGGFRTLHGTQIFCRIRGSSLLLRRILLRYWGQFVIPSLACLLLLMMSDL